MKGVAGRTYSTNYFQQLTLENWYTNFQQMPLNRCQQVPVLYKRLIQHENETNRLNNNQQQYFTSPHNYFKRKIYI